MPSLEQDGITILEGSANMELLDKIRDSAYELLSSKDPRQVQNTGRAFTALHYPYSFSADFFRLAMNDDLLQIANDYLGGQVKFGSCGFRRSHVTQGGPTSTNLFHSDGNYGTGFNFVKIFYYLNDVDEEGGPFEYILGTHKNKKPGWTRKYRWDDKEIYDTYGKENSYLATAKYGDIIIADTTGFHRGLKVKKRERTMLTINLTTNLGSAAGPKVTKECIEYKDHPACKYVEWV